MMDPNLIKIRDSNMNLVKKGRLRRPLYHAKDYLLYIHRDKSRAHHELDQFKTHLQSLKVNRG